MARNAGPAPATRRRRAAAALTIPLVLAIVATGVALAQGDLGGKIRSGSDVRVGPDESIATDLYVFGGTVLVEGTIQGDLVVFAGTVTVRGTVEGDVLVAAGTIRVEGAVTGDLRVAGGQVAIAGAVGEDVLVAGGQVELASGGSIGEDMIASAGQLTVAGTVAGSITGGAGFYSRTGTVGGTDEIVVAPQRPAQDRTLERIGDALRHFLAVVLVGLLALLAVPRLVHAAAGAIGSDPLAAVAWGVAILVAGIAALVAIPLVAVLLGILLALLGFDELVALLVLATVAIVFALIAVGTVLFGYLADAVVGLGLVRLFRPGADAATGDQFRGAAAVLPLIAGAAVVVLLVSLPVVGPLLKLVVMVLGAGALLAAWRRPRGPLPRAAAEGWVRPA